MPEETSPGEIDGKIKAGWGEILDLQSKIVIFSRDMADRARQLAEAFEMQAERCHEIAALHDEGTQIAAAMFADIIVAEAGQDFLDDKEGDDS